MSLDTIVDLTITVQSSAPTRAGFGTPLIAAYHTAWSDRVREYRNADDMLEDGFTTDDPAYGAALALKSQKPAPKTFKVGRRALPFTTSLHLYPQIIDEGYEYKFDGADFAELVLYTVQTGDTLADVVDGLAAGIQALGGNTSSGVGSPTHDHVVLTLDAAGVIVPYINFNDHKDVLILNATTDPGIVTDLAAIALEDDDWYGLLIDSNSSAEILAAAAWVEARRKIFTAHSGDFDILDDAETGDLFSQLQTGGYARTIPLFHHRPFDQYASAAWEGGRLTTQPGSDTWAFKTLSGVDASTLNQGAQSAIEGKKGNHYTATGGINITYQGISGAGEFADVTRFIDWLFARIQERLLFVLANNAKIPYTDAGVDTIVAAIQGVLNQGIKAGGLAATPAPSVTAPKVADVDPVDKANRLLPDVEFTATLAGAIHQLVITGKVSV